MENLSDIKIQCIDCKTSFLFTIGEQEFMQGLKNDGKIASVNAPKRCGDCRQKKKERYEKMNRSN